jgi:hypothetical protein
MASAPSIEASSGRRRLVARVRQVDRITAALGFVFFVSAVFYLWTAATSVPLSLHDGPGDRYNLLASAFLHFRLSVGPAPAALVHSANPYSPETLIHVFPTLHSTTDATSINDDVMYRGQLYFLWGPAPALVLLVPLHLLGFEPSSSVTVAVYATVGLGFALATLRLILRQIGEGGALWMCALAGLTMSLCSVMPYLSRTPTVTTDTLAGGYCFVMAGIWLAVSAITSRRATATRLALMSLCIGLALNSRPPLALTALILSPVYVALRSTRPRRSLLTWLTLPLGICVLLWLGYNQARFNNPFEVGSRLQLTIPESTTAPFGRLSYVLPGLGFYALTPPRFEVLFPFIHLLAPQTLPPPGMPQPELTGGLLPMAPIVTFIAALPWIWRRRPKVLGPLGAPLVLVAGIGLMLPVIPSYQLFASTERYEADFATLLVLGGLGAWLSLSTAISGYKRWLIRVGGGLLAVWSCASGFAISFYGSGAELAVTHPAVWRALEDIGSPLSTVLATAVGHPILGAVQATNGGINRLAPHEPLSTSVSEFSLNPVEHAGLTIVSPDQRRAALVANVGILAGSHYEIRIDGPGKTSNSYKLPAGGGVVDLPVSLKRGLNRFTVRAVASSAKDAKTTAAVIEFSSISISG